MRTLHSISILIAVALLTTLAVAQGRARGGFTPPQNQNRPGMGTPRRETAPPTPKPQQTQQPRQQQPQAPAQPQQQKPQAQDGQVQGALPQGTQRQPDQAGRAGQRFGDWLRDHQNLPVDQQMKLLEQERAFQQLNSEQQQRLRERLQRFSSLPPDQRARRLEHLQRLEQLTPDERRRAEDILTKFRGLPDDRRVLVGRAAGLLSRMDPQQQQRMLDSPRIRQQFSDQEREMLHGILDLRIGPASPGPRDGQQPPEEP